jgi:hypothetical protein
MRALWAAFALAAAAQTASAQVDAATFDWSGAVPAGATVRVYDVDGNIRVTGTTSGSQVTVHGERTHVLSGGRALVFAVVKDGDDVTICAYHRDGRCDARGAHGGGPIIGISIHDPSADFTVELPAGVNLATSSGDGSIEVHGAGADVLANSGDGSVLISGAAGDVKVRSGDGDVTIENAQRAVTAHTGDGAISISSASGPVTAISGDGDVRVHLASEQSAGDVNLHTGDGSVTIFVAPQFAGHVDASTSDGHIESDLPLGMTGRMDPQHIHATIGSGEGVQLIIRTGDGDINIKRE